MPDQWRTLQSCLTSRHFELAIEIGFSQLKPTEIYKDNDCCIALANSMPLCTQQTHCSVCVVVHKRIQDEILNIKQCTTAANIANCRHRDKGFTSHTFWKLFGSCFLRQAPWRCWQMISHQAKCVILWVFYLFCVGRLLYLGDIVLLCNYIVAIHLSWWFMSKRGDVHVCCIETICCQFMMCTCFSPMNVTWIDVATPVSHVGGGEHPRTKIGN